MGPIKDQLRAHLGRLGASSKPHPHHQLSAHQYLYEPLESEKHIRLLKIEYRRDERSKFRPHYEIIQTVCPLEPDSEVRRYHCLSYRWGDPRDLQKLALAGGKGYVNVTSNLMEAIEQAVCSRVRTGYVGYIWIDQICIDQNNMIEKLQQVRRMGTIYRLADHVIVWLAGGNGWTQDDLYNESYDKDHLVLSTSACNYLFELEWFRRSWVVQEFALACSVEFFLGQHTFTREDLILYSEVGNHADTDPPTATATQSRTAFAMMNIVRAYVELPGNERTATKDLRLLQLCSQSFQRSQRADCINAFLGLLPNIRHALRYDKDFIQQLISFAHKLIIDMGSLDILIYAAGLQRDAQLQDIPSWVPPWQAAPGFVHLGGSFGFDCHLREDAKRLLAIPKWSADGIHKFQFSTVSLNDRFLRVRGRRIDAVKIAIDVSDTGAGYLITDSVLVDELWRKLWYRFRASAGITCPCEEFISAISAYGASWGNLTNDMKKIKAVLDMWLIETEADRVGIVAKPPQPGDVVAILHGCPQPVLLRSAGGSNDRYEVVAACFVHGMMHGEVVDWEPEDAETFVLV